MSKKPTRNSFLGIRRIAIYLLIGSILLSYWAISSGFLHFGSTALADDKNRNTEKNLQRDGDRPSREGEAKRDGDRPSREGEVKRDGDRPSREGEVKRDGDARRDVTRRDRPQNVSTAQLYVMVQQLQREVALLRAEVRRLQGRPGERETREGDRPRREGDARREGARPQRDDGDRPQETP